MYPHNSNPDVHICTHYLLAAHRGRVTKGPPIHQFYCFFSSTFTKTSFELLAHETYQLFWSPHLPVNPAAWTKRYKGGRKSGKDERGVNRWSKMVKVNCKSLERWVVCHGGVLKTPRFPLNLSKPASHPPPPITYQSPDTVPFHCSCPSFSSSFGLIMHFGISPPLEVPQICC